MELIIMTSIGPGRPCLAVGTIGQTAAFGGAPQEHRPLSSPGQVDTSFNTSHTRSSEMEQAGSQCKGSEV